MLRWLALLWQCATWPFALAAALDTPQALADAAALVAYASLHPSLPPAARQQEPTVTTTISSEQPVTQAVCEQGRCPLPQAASPPGRQRFLLRGGWLRRR